MAGRRETDKTVCTRQRPILDWKSINWTKIRKDVKKWQQEIFRETRAGDLEYLKFEPDAVKVACPVLLSRGR